MKIKLDLNCDLGEHESPAATSSLMRQVSSANIACGGHAGDLASMRRSLLLAKKHKVRAGAHPGLADKSGFGRSEQNISPGELQILLCSQISCLETIARLEKVRLRHVKLHGALYQMVEQDPRLGKIYLETIATFWPKLAIRSIAGGRIHQTAQRMGLSVSPELFGDRAYLNATTLLPRSQPGALVSSADLVVSRVKDYLSDGRWPMQDGATFCPTARTICIHGDTPGAAGLLRKLRKLLC